MEQNTHTRLSIGIQWYDTAAFAEDVIGYFAGLLRAIYLEMQDGHPRLEQIRALTGLGDYAATNLLDNFRLTQEEADAAIAIEQAATPTAPADRVESP